MPVVNPVTGLELIQYQGGNQTFHLDNVRALFEDWITETSNATQWTTVSIGAGATTTRHTSGVQDHPGVMECRTGTTATGGSMHRGNFTSPGIVIPTGRWRLRQMALLGQLSTVAQAFTAMLCGLSDVVNVSGTVVNNGAWFEYTHAVNGGNWTAKTKSGGVETAIDTGIPADTGWHEFGIEGNADSQVDFYIDGVLVASSQTNCPTAANPLNYLPMRMLKSAGLTSCFMWTDYFFHGWSIRTPR